MWHVIELDVDSVDRTWNALRGFASSWSESRPGSAKRELASSTKRLLTSGAPPPPPSEGAPSPGDGGGGGAPPPPPWPKRATLARCHIASRSFDGWRLARMRSVRMFSELSSDSSYDPIESSDSSLSSFMPLE